MPIKTRSHHHVLSLFWIFLTSCNCQQADPVYLPAILMGKAELVETCESSCDSEILKHAIMEPGKGGISSGVLVRLTDDVRVYRLWNGPKAGLNEYGGSNRIGSWWSPEKPSGTVDDYRHNNAVCEEWNKLEWVAKCTLKKGSLVAVGPTQSANCQKGDSFAANSTMQIYVDNVATRYVTCPKIESENPTERDFEANPNELLQEKTSMAPHVAPPQPQPTNSAHHKRKPKI